MPRKVKMSPKKAGCESMPQPEAIHMPRSAIRLGFFASYISGFSAPIILVNTLTSSKSSKKHAVMDLTIAITGFLSVMKLRDPELKKHIGIGFTLGVLTSLLPIALIAYQSNTCSSVSP